MTFDEQVAELRKTVAPKQSQKRKQDCTPAEWAAKLEYAKQQWRSLDGGTKKKRVATMSEWNRANAASRRAYYRKYCKQRRAADVQFRLRGSISHRMREAVRRHVAGGGVRPQTTMRLLGCTIDALVRHLESQFLPGMTWDNWGFGEGKWHIDHVLPLAGTDLTDAQKLRLVCHYTNLRPLWEQDNLSKNSRVDLSDVISHAARIKQ